MFIIIIRILKCIQVYKQEITTENRFVAYLHYLLITYNILQGHTQSVTQGR